MIAIAGRPPPPRGTLSFDLRPFAEEYVALVWDVAEMIWHHLGVTSRLGTIAD